MKIQSLVSALMLVATLAHAEMDLEMTGPEYRVLLEQTGADRLLELDSTSAGNELQHILKAGKRNLDWLEAVNAARPEESKLQLSKPETTVGIPIDKPRESNGEIVVQAYRDLHARFTPSFWAVIDGNGAVPTPVPADMTDEQYLEATRKVDSVYQSASRWTLQLPALFAYAARAKRDIRGYHFLSREPELDSKLRGWHNLSAADHARLQPLLIGECRNSGKTAGVCLGELGRAVNRRAVHAFHGQYVVGAKRMYDTHFRIQSPRRDATWTAANPNSMVVPFAMPESEEVRKWLADNIQDEWRFGDWQLSLDFQNSSSWSMTHVVFEAGSTPHVNGLGGSEITMDANRSIHEYLTRWTIRHEYGHTLGFPDCYIEFYDSERRVMINYQIDTDNLMCSRRGHIQQTHVDELKRSYFGT